MNRADEELFREFVAARMDRLRRTAYLLCHDWHTADDLVAVTLDKLYRHWRTATQAASPDAYVRTILTRAWIDERRRPWRRESTADQPPDRAVEDTYPGADRQELVGLLAGLTPRRRAAVVLRF